MSEMDLKRVLRKEMKQIISKLSNEEKNRQSIVIQQKILSHPKWQEAKRISIYLSLKSEVDTSLIMNQIFQDQKQCFVPRYKSRSTLMEMIELESLEEYKSLPETNWGIKQFADNSPKQDASLTGGLDLILLPGLAFYPNGGKRLGKGGGFYDTYLNNLLKFNQSLNRPMPYLIGLSFKEQLRADIPMTERDYRIDEVVTV